MKTKISDDTEVLHKRNDISDYSSRSKSNFFSKDESSSFLGMSDDMITIEDTYKETEQKFADKPKASYLPSNYLINHMEMNVIEEQDDEEDKSCASSFHKSNNNMSGYNSNDPYYLQSHISKENKKNRESFETFGQKSLAGVMNTVKSDSKESRKIDDSYESEKPISENYVENIAETEQDEEPANEEPKEEEKAHRTDEKFKRNIETDDSTDISAQITKRTNHTRSSGYKGDKHTSCLSMPALNLESLTKFRVDNRLSRESYDTHSNRSSDKPCRINVQDYCQMTMNRLKTNTSQADDESVNSIIIVDSETSKYPISSQLNIITENPNISQSNKSSRIEEIKLVKDIAQHHGELGISSILENTGNNDETDILEYCTPNYATNTSKLFSTKGNDVGPVNTYSSDKLRNSSGGRIIVDINNLESFSLGPNRSLETRLMQSKKDAQRLVEELRSLEEENQMSDSSYIKEVERENLEELGLSMLELDKESQAPSKNTSNKQSAKKTETSLHAKYIQQMHERMEREKEQIIQQLDEEQKKTEEMEAKMKELEAELGMMS